jgi:hypothetical protein
MTRAIRVAAGVAVACAVSTLHATPADRNGLAFQSGPPSVLQRFLARAEEPPVEYRALRRLEAQNPKFKQSAWMVAWTEYDRVNGFRYEVVDEGGSGYIRTRVLRAALDGEQKIWADREPQKASFNHDNYMFDDGPVSADGLAEVGVKPKRKDMLLVEGAIFVQPSDGELSRIEGKLSKTPSFWTRRVDVVRRYERKAGVRVPVAIESVAHVLIAGRSTFKMTYEYQTINGQHVGDPQPRAQASAAH